MSSKLWNAQYRKIIGSLGYFCYNIESLQELNAILASYGPDVFRTFERVTVKSKPGQESDIVGSNIKVASFTGDFYIDGVVPKDIHKICYDHIN